MGIPSIFCFSSFLTASHYFFGVSNGMFTPVFIQFPWLFFSCFPSGFPMIPILDFVISWIIVKATAWIVIEKETKKANNKNKKKQKLSYCSGTRIHNHLVCKRTLNHLAKLAESI